eukprot:CAMPEP_0115585262 /NCGR_PEP_ID=MMETSP0272-20121206/7105_1 /TAXON_ID=71861 /ORGANISM="Scrippsiella trochoidea, Strain CCMP3099" /LENGTH=116 /DNA_ID=CAMNT_0003020315 /DNA_START=480 /DNA_END=828 /DNA_ORIENTATION=-
MRSVSLMGSGTFADKLLQQTSLEGVCSDSHTGNILRSDSPCQSASDGLWADASRVCNDRAESADTTERADPIEVPATNSSGLSSEVLRPMLLLAESCIGSPLGAATSLCTSCGASL